MDSRNFKLVATYDTETCNLGTGEIARAFPILFIFDDLTNVNLREYTPDCEAEKILFFRNVSETIKYIESIIQAGLAGGYTPIIAAYNLMFDLQPIMYELRLRYNMQVNAQSTTNVYTLDLLGEEDNIVLRFWDTFHLEMNGLSAMGRTCNFSKAIGSWDYSLVRTPETPLTKQELEYAKIDVQIIAAYMRYLLDANEWLTPEMLGVNVITKTSLVRQMAKRVIGVRKYTNAHNKRVTLNHAFDLTCKQEFATDYNSYALRKACFRGGFTFTAAAYASTVQERVASLDVTSMHHLFINGRKIPVHFVKAEKYTLERVCEDITSKTIDYVLSHYERPFLTAIHARIEFKNIRLKAGSAFNEYGIALLAQAKFKKTVEQNDYSNAENVRNILAEEYIREQGYMDIAHDAVFAFGKLYSASSVIVCVNEYELWNISRVYDWDIMNALEGEISVNAVIPPDYVTLQSNLLFAQKTDAKTISANYKEGIPYPLEIPESIPDGIKDALKAGTISEQFLVSWYNSTVKGAFNSIYGTMSQDVMRPDYVVSDDAEFYLDAESKATPNTYDDLKPKKIRVLYTYGMRIVAGSRTHLIIAIELLYKKFKDSARVTGGDTDSIKLSCDKNIAPEQILDALEPLHVAARTCIERVQRRVRDTQQELASALIHIGEFEIENASKNKVFYDYHLEAWNKARVSIVDGKAHITCAGLSRPQGAYTIERYIEDALQVIPAEQLLPLILSYNVYVDNSVAHALEHKRPQFADKISEIVTDYQGNTYDIDTYASVALYPTGRWLGDTAKKVNADNVNYLQEYYAREVDTREKTIAYRNGKPELWIDCEDGEINLLCEKSCNNKL